MSEHLRFAPDVLRRLGEELNPSPEQGMLELVRNAYDADAASCKVELIDVSKAGGELIITDDGDGMTAEQLRDSWLVLGRSSKVSDQRTATFDRLQVGSKGLGRLAALRLGPVATLRTRPASDPGVEHTLVLDWSLFDNADTVDLVDLEIVTGPSDERSGTTIEVKDLRRKFSTAEVTRIARALLLLSSPFESSESFKLSLTAPEFEALEKLVSKGYLEQAAYELRGGIDADGRAWATMTDHERRGRVSKAKHEDLRRLKESPPYTAPEAEFELFVFRLSGDGSTRGLTSGVTLGALREWLKLVGGVHLYHRGLRVHPYGDPGHDWIDMNLRRVSSPEERPSTNNSIGRVLVVDEEAVLQQKTDRTGFIETPAFEDLRTFAQDVLDWAARLRLAEAEERRRREKRRARATLQSAQEGMQEAIAAAPPGTRRALEQADRRVRQATSREFDAVVEDLELYRTLATIGTTTAVMAHEATNPPNTIIKAAKSVRRRARELLKERYGERMEGPIYLIESNARRIQTLVELPRRLLDRSKRRRGTHSLNLVIRETVAMLKPLVDEHQVKFEYDLDGSEPSYLGTIAALESVITNLVINSVNALNATAGTDRLIRLQTVSEGKHIILDVADNGPGIRTIKLDDIWLPGRGTTERGVGLGLTIVRDIVADLDGSIAARAKGELGGAQFTIEIPQQGQV
ncbi:MAG TPA: ATP-binding protein [Solirubrobacteraceae bacterium]|jgi:signal transduction histidine kinase|nr:ATP-binding protein [Solirubrobacteraceae bacterium]